MYAQKILGKKSKSVTYGAFLIMAENIYPVLGKEKYIKNTL